MSDALDTTDERAHDVRGCGQLMILMAVSRDGLQGWWCPSCNVVRWDDHPGQQELFT